MESVDADCYVLEYMIRDRLTNARARARVAALLVDASDSHGPNGVNGPRQLPGVKEEGQ